MGLPMTKQGRVVRKQLSGKSCQLYGTKTKNVYVVTDGNEAPINNQDTFTDRGKPKYSKENLPQWTKWHWDSFCQST